MEEYYNMLNGFIEMKKKYENKYKNSIELIKKEKISNDEKYEKVRSIRLKCICCNRNVGTIFSLRDRTYRAICGDQNNPCALNIEIKRPNIIHLKDEMKEFKNKAENSALEIVKSKYSLIFGLRNEAEIMSQFEQLQQDYNDNNEAYETVLAYLENVMKDYLERQKQANEAEKQYYQQIVNMKDMLKMASEIPHTQSDHKALIYDAISTYINEIQPTIERIRKNRYSKYEMEENYLIDSTAKKETTQLVKTKLSNEELEYVLEEPTVLMFTKGQCNKEKTRFNTKISKTKNN